VKSGVVHTEGLTKDFLIGFWRRRPHRALDAVSLDIPSGEVFGLLGPNGAGKSTTLKLLLNLIWPTAGRAEVFGRPPGDVGARRRLGFLPENPTFYDYLTAEELITYFAGLFGYTRADCTRRAAAVLDTVGLGADRRRRLRQFSKGMMQRVGLAAALVNDAELVILDEPMSGLDPVGRREVREIILRLRDEGRTVLFSSHILSDAETLCSSVGILSRGRLVVAGPLSELMARGTATSTATGWEIVMSGITSDAADRLTAAGVRVIRISDGRYNVVLDGSTRPERVITDLAAAGASLVSVTPLKTTLEDVFMRAVEPGTPEPQNPAPRQARGPRGSTR
jgi:ABC-2 type transport system ATP-binding protein